MTYIPEINRRYVARCDAWGYLASRGFGCVPGGWRNGRWLATVKHDLGGFKVRIWLPVPEIT